MTNYFIRAGSYINTDNADRRFGVFPQQFDNFRKRCVKCGRVGTDSRSLLSPNHIEQLAFLSQNIPKTTHE